MTQLPSLPRRAPLAVRLLPVPGECLGSWLRNCAHLADVPVAALLDYLELPTFWADGDLSRGVWREGRYRPDETEILLRCLNETFGYPLAKLRRMVVHAVPRALRRGKLRWGCPDCAASDVAAGLLPRIQRAWLLKSCHFCDRHQRPLEAFNVAATTMADQSARRERKSGARVAASIMPDDQAFTRQLDQGLLLGWDPAGPVPHERLQVEYGRRASDRVQEQPSELAVKQGELIVRDHEIVWFMHHVAPAEERYVQPVLSSAQMADVVALVGPKRRPDLLVFRNNTAVKMPIAAVEAALHAVDQQRLNRAYAKLVNDRAHVVERCSDNLVRTSASLPIAAYRVGQRHKQHLDHLWDRLARSIAPYRSVEAQAAWREQLRSEVREAQASAGSALIDDAIALRRHARRLLDAAGHSDLDPLFSADMAQFDRDVW